MTLKNSLLFSLNFDLGNRCLVVAVSGGRSNANIVQDPQTNHLTKNKIIKQK